jgi:hypothetical protein
MPVDERARHRLFDKLEAVLGTEEAAILMEHLPPVGWADVATKHDLDALGELLRQSIETLEQRQLATMRLEMIQQNRTEVIAMLTLFVSYGALALAAARLL